MLALGLAFGKIQAMTHIEVPSSSPRRGGSGRGWSLVLGLIAIFILGFALWTWLTMAWSYSDGERAGILQKFSHRGWLCKTQEGELAMFIVAGVAPQIWDFSVRDPVVAEQLNKSVGRRVQLHYTEHPGIPTNCFADTRYFVDRITLVDESPGATR